MVAWNEMMFSKQDSWVGQYAAVVKLKRSDDCKVVVTLISGAVIASQGKSYGGSWCSWCRDSRGSNVTLEIEDRPMEQAGVIWA